MSKLYYEAMKVLPDQFVDEKTVSLDSTDCVFVANPEHGIMWYRKEIREWQEMKFVEREILKAENDIAIYGNGAVFVNNEGEVKHIPLEKMHGKN